MAAFEDAVAIWRHQAFPPGSSSEALAELHADLALADTCVAESVIPFVERGLRKPARVDVVKGLRDLDARAGELEQRSDGADRRLAAAYRDYAAVLLRVYEAFLAQVSSDA
jgi:hypothetical protein